MVHCGADACAASAFSISAPDFSSFFLHPTNDKSAMKRTIKHILIFEYDCIVVLFIRILLDIAFWLCPKVMGDKIIKEVQGNV
jgi:hypothetical protein